MQAMISAKVLRDGRGGGSEEAVWARRLYGDFENGGLGWERGRRLTRSPQNILYSTEDLSLAALKLPS